MNLVINAAEAIGPQGGTVLVRTGVQAVDEQYIRTLSGSGDLKPGQYAMLEVHDTGCGMTEETLKRIFDPFFTTKFAGRGLGLSAVLGIVRAHKGALKVYSQPGRGTTFKLLFPISTVAPAAEPVAPEGDLAGSGTILIVDDEDVVRRTARNTLQRYGYRTLLAEDGRQALETYRRERDISLVLLDLTMPVMSGEETLQQLQVIGSRRAGGADQRLQRNRSGPAFRGQRPVRIYSETLHGGQSGGEGEGRDGAGARVPARRRRDRRRVSLPSCGLRMLH